MNFIATAQVTLGLNYEFADTATKSTGITNGTDNSVRTHVPMFQVVPSKTDECLGSPFVPVQSTAGDEP